MPILRTLGLGLPAEVKVFHLKVIILAGEGARQDEGLAGELDCVARPSLRHAGRASLMCGVRAHGELRLIKGRQLTKPTLRQGIVHQYVRASLYR